MPDHSVTPQRSAFPFTIAAIAGVALWIGASVISGKREPWDASVYWIAVYPVAVALSFLLGYFYPQRPWRWPLTLFLCQFVGMAIRNGEVGSLWPLGLALFAVLSVPGILVAKLASWLRARRAGPAS
jgi:hypothetical protein